MQMQVTIIGGGLAGSEAAWQLAERSIKVQLYEMRPVQQTPIHKTAGLAELVCSNSLKSLDANSAAGLLKYELAALGSYLLACALKTRVAAGGALAVDREAFSNLVTKSIAEHPNITVIRKEANLSQLLEAPNPCIIATGPLTSPAFANTLEELLGSQNLAFYDAAAPIVEACSLDTEKLFRQSRYDKGSADYLNAPLTKEQYDLFIQELVTAQKVIPRAFETRELFSACQPIEEIARKGHDALRFGALKPVGLTDPATGRRPWAAVQLRQENRAATAYNLVGFQTNLLFSEQKRIFRLIPGLKNAEFSRYGVMHRNTFINAPQVLSKAFALRTHPMLYFAGQITGTEGYAEAIASGLFAALNCYAQLRAQAQLQEEGRLRAQGEQHPQQRKYVPVLLPQETACGSLFAYATDSSVTDYQPMHVNFGIIKPLTQLRRRKQERYAAYSARSKLAIEAFREHNSALAFLPGYDIADLLS